MTRSIDFDRYWGVRICAIELDLYSMSLVFNLSWTDDFVAYTACLRFIGVSKCDFLAEKTFLSEVVELVSLEGRRLESGWSIMAELSNYELLIFCADVSVDEGTV